MAGFRTVLFAGFGYVAEATAARLCHRAHIIASTRSAESAETIEQAGYEALRADPATREGQTALAEAAGRADAILLSAPPGEAGDPFLQALSAIEPRLCWLGYLSTTGVYGDRAGGWAFERDPLTPGLPRSVRRAEAEAAWMARGARVFRLSGIYGPGRSALDKIRAGNAQALDKPGQVFSRVHVEDIAQALERALDRPEAAGAFNLADDHPSSQVEVLCGAADLLGMARPDIIRFDPEAASPMQASFFAECRRVSNARAKAVLGWRPAYRTWREGLRAILEANG